MPPISKYIKLLLIFSVRQHLSIVHVYMSIALVGEGEAGYSMLLASYTCRIYLFFACILPCFALVTVACLREKPIAKLLDKKSLQKQKKQPTVALQ